MTESENLDAELRRLAKREAEVVAEIAALLLKIKRGDHHARLGWSSLADYAREALGYSARKVRELVELAERAEKLPRIRAAFERGEVGWTKLRAVARVATAGDEGEWLARARAMSLRELERAATEATGEQPKIRLVVEVTAEEYADLEDAIRAVRQERREGCSREQALLELVRRGAAGGEGCSREQFRTVIYRCDECERATRETREGPVEVAPATAAMAECDSEVVDAREPRRIAHAIPPRTRRLILERDRRRCVVPGCTNRDFVHVHHIDPRARGGDHRPANLATLCSQHHGAVHQGVLQIEGDAPLLRFFTASGAEILPAAARASSVDLSAEARTLASALAAGPDDLDSLIERTGLGAPAVLRAVSELEEAGLARREPGLVLRPLAPAA